MILRLTIELPRSVKNFMAAMFRVGLGEHHQLNIMRIPAELGESGDKIINFILRQRQSQHGVRRDQRGATGRQQGYTRHRLRLAMTKKRGAGV